MATPVLWGCFVVLAAGVVAYAQRHSQQDTHVLYERLGSDVTLPCGTAAWDTAVTWRVNGTDLEAAHLNGSQLILEGLDLSHSGHYACYQGSSWHLRYQALLHVGMPPREPVLTCRSNSYPKGFYCSWHLPAPTFIPNTFNVTVLHGSKLLGCEKDPAPKNRCHIRYTHLFSTVKYKVTLTVTNALGHNSTAITFDEFTIVKPDPPENVVARPVPSSPRRLEVTWQTPSSWPDPESFPLKFFLRYRPLILDQWQHKGLSKGMYSIVFQDQQDGELSGGQELFFVSPLFSQGPGPWWSCQMAQHTPSLMHMLGRSTSFRWLLRTTRLGHGVTGAWPPMPHLGLRSPDTLQQRLRLQRPPPPPPHPSSPLPPRRSVILERLGMVWDPQLASC